ncbi:hypothetical protein HanPSC8_Chr17g0798191 [Helianthus annuus]|nr:hypothetical protein HanPSC8_Chr17g0798191 [Helianthus annuus]
MSFGPVSPFTVSLPPLLDASLVERAIGERIQRRKTTKMSNETPKLYVHKPKKAQLKKHLQQQSRSSPSPSPAPVTASSSSSMASQSTASSSRLPPTPPKESLARRYKFLWPLLLAVNFSVGGTYISVIYRLLLVRITDHYSSRFLLISVFADKYRMN